MYKLPMTVTMQASARAVPVSVYDLFPRLTVRLVSASISCHILVYCREVDRRCKWLSSPRLSCIACVHHSATTDIHKLAKEITILK